MNQDLALKVLGHVMDWTDERAREEFRWLKLMARLKYDGYRDFQAGMRFIESLATWLQQFEANERETAYRFVRESLVYIGPGEMQRLVEQFYPRTVHDRLIRTIAAERSIPTYRVLADTDAWAATQRLRRQTLFMGLSDGARIDTIRHVNGHLTNEQLVQGIQVDTDKWKGLRDDLRKDLKDDNAGFRLIYLIDDFAGTGTTFIRLEKGSWKGKLMRFRESITAATRELGSPIVSPDWELCIHFYLASAKADQDIRARLDEARSDLASEIWTRSTIHPSFGVTFPEDLPIDSAGGRHDAFIELTRKYYNSSIESSHTEKGGVKHLGLGYGGCALPLVLDHNTPNNTVALVWAEVEGSGDEPEMRPLFRRRQRHN